MTTQQQPTHSGTFELTPMQGRWMRKARQLAETVLRPNAVEIDGSASFPRANLEQLNRAGLLALTIPKDKGGVGADVGTVALVLQEIAKGCASTAMCAAMHYSTVPLVAALAKGPQIERVLEPLIRGELLGASATSEFGSGSRIWHSQGYAERGPDGFRITADKSFVTSAGEADFYVAPVLARKGAKSDDMSLFLIEREHCKVPPEGAWDALGFRGTASSPMRFRDVRLPPDALLGDEGAGFTMIVCFHFPLYHVGLSALFIGIAEAALQDALAFVQARDKGSKSPLGSTELAQSHFGEMRIRLTQAKALLARVAHLTDRALRVMLEIAEIGMAEQITERLMKSDDFFLEVSALKAVATECAIDVTNLAMRVCGGAAYKRGHPVERHYRDARAGALMAPNNDSLRTLIGKHLLGYPFPWEEEPS
ncbi:MAG: acyl-CoA dehydrogenase family protein [Kofleriaceae bacterium]